MSPIFFTDQGNGSPIVLLHGFCENHLIWKEFSGQLAKNFRVITPDLPGFGKSRLPKDSFSIADIAKQLNNWLAEFKIRRPVIIGHSLGGYIALAMANEGQLALSGLGLFHSTPFADSEEKRANRDKTIDFVKRNGVAPFVETFVPNLFYKKDHASIAYVEELALQTPLETVIGYSIAMRDRPSQEEFLKNRFFAYFLVVAGMYDSIITTVVSEKAVALVANTSFHTLADSGHMGMFENREDSIELISDFATKCFGG